MAVPIYTNDGLSSDSTLRLHQRPFRTCRLAWLNDTVNAGSQVERLTCEDSPAFTVDGRTRRLLICTTRVRRLQICIHRNRPRIVTVGQNRLISSFSFESGF